MKYFKMYKVDEREEEITKEEARRTLEGYWSGEALDDIFKNDRAFRLYTPVAIVYTLNADGMIPIPGFYGIVG